MAIPSTAKVRGEADDELQALGILAVELQNGALAGYTAGTGFTRNHPRVLPGINVWGEAIAHLRDIWAPRGWIADSTSNLETVVHPANTHCVAVVAGTSQTGIAEGYPPRTRRPRGSATGRAVKRNASGQQPLGMGTDAFAGTGVPMVADDKRITWMLLHYLDVEAEEIRLELSCPLEMSDKQIKTWRKRIIVPAVAFSDNVDIDDFDDPEIDIDITRKAN